MSRFTWRLFGLLIAVPALSLAWLGLRAVGAERFESERQLRERQRQIAQLADAAVLNTLNQLETGLHRAQGGAAEAPANIAADLAVVTFDRSGLVTFSRDKVYFGPFGRHPPERERLTQWPAALAPLVDQAQTAEVQGRTGEALALLQRIRAAEPRLQAWADIVRARLRLRSGDGAALSALVNREWSRSPDVTPSGLPVAFVACAVSEGRPDHERRAFVPLLESTIAGLRAGRWWLNADERRFYDAQLRTLLHSAGGAMSEADTRLGALGEIEQAVRQAPPTRRNAPTYGLERGPTSTFLMIWAPSAADSEGWVGAAVPQDRAAVFMGPSLDRLFAEQPFRAAIRDLSGAVVWGSRSAAAAPWHTEPLQAVRGWNMTFTGPAEDAGMARRQWLWYGFVFLTVIVLFAALGMTTHTVRREMELARLQSDFVAGVTHEFKSPLTSIRLLLERIAGGRIVSAEAAASYCGAIGQETNRLERLVNRLLEAQQIDAGQRQYRCAPESLEDVTTEVIRHLQPVADAKGVTIEVRIDRPIPPVLIERASIADAIENLVDNAIKYSPPRARIGVRIHVDAQRVCVDVEDEGIGIDRDEIPRVFDKFYRGRRADRQNVRGTGLGLALVKAAAEAHGGSVDVSSEPGVGSRFSLRLPA